MSLELINQLLTDRLEVLNKQTAKNCFSSERHCFFEANKQQLKTVLPSNISTPLFKANDNSYAHMIDIMKILQILNSHDKEYSFQIQCAIDKITSLYIK